MLLRLPFTLLGNLIRLLLFIIARTVAIPLNILLASSRRKRKLYAELTLNGDLAIAAEDSSLSRWFPPPASLLQTRRDLKTLAQDPRLSGVVLHVQASGLGTAQAADLRDMIDALRDSGKHVIAHADGASTPELLLMSAAEHTLISPPGRLYTFSPRIEELFVAPLIQHLKLAPQFIHIGPFKTATHRLHKSEMTTPQRLMMSSLHQGLCDLIYSRIATRRDITPEAVKLAIDHAPLEARHAARHNLIDAPLYVNDLPDWIAVTRYDAPIPNDPEEPSPRDHAHVQLTSAHHIIKSQPRKLGWRPLLRRPRYIALLDLTGPIASSPGTIGQAPSLPGRGPSIRADEVISTLNELRDDPRCAALLLHINSPGGSALASDLIWSALDRLRDQLPIVAYCSDVAASGGYYIACAAHQIVCRPETITGSIGVITGKLAIGDALTQLGIRTEAIEASPSSRFNSLFAPLPDEVLHKLQADARDFYTRFLARVGQARGIYPERLHRWARGRVYLGQDAHQRQLVDDLGGLERAIELVYQLAQTTEAHTPLRFIEHRHITLRDRLNIPFLSTLTPQPPRLATRALDSLEHLTWLADTLQHEHLLALMPLQITTGRRV